ncbi:MULTISPECIES: hypothetical protein [Bacillus cereus group]|uniref:Uncharacterized protein n=1 Tax=Bacillus cereus TaxID=1396 RepID=A0A9X6W2Y9_BACCE|nr:MULTISPECIES: hypothetical protein [Bacillus cereus group]MDX5808662.1 hypothetical protein [Bacillus cereus group sp. BfR-BA-02730]PES55515.1 hypothetical protein CN515_05585 [Bacillus cereus]PFF52008.1 hypothetical protein CN357_04785 [Bacillus cereus]PFQ39776.1 hypothetical protein COK33_10015 [Bacillus cereus]PGB15707.1 hypothetical protein COM09_08995 [Bacillus toyonensis]
MNEMKTYDVILHNTNDEKNGIDVWIVIECLNGITYQIEDMYLSVDTIDDTLKLIRKTMKEAIQQKVPLSITYARKDCDENRYFCIDGSQVLSFQVLASGIKSRKQKNVS